MNTRKIVAFFLFANLSLATVPSIAQSNLAAMQKYGVCSGVDESCYSGWFDRSSGDEAPWKILIFYHVGAGVRPHANRDYGVAAMTRALEDKGYTVVSSEDPATMQSGFGLRAFDAIVFFNTGRDALDSLGQMALRIYIEGGGGFVGIHNAFGTNFNWTWYEGLLGGAQLYDHGPFQPGKLRLHSNDDASTSHLDDNLVWSDEFYNLRPDPLADGDVRLLLSVDEKSMLKGTQGYFGHPGFGDRVHPVSWCHYYDGGRAWLTTLGHSEEIFDDAAFVQHVVGGIESAMGKAAFCQ